ncbi:hypothetical protein [Rhodothermus marinus]|uniref:hypothetical protein n=1 Tax=Rhodothermus marinus TaxID=29549 RepID=UPI000A9A5A7A|nr:hypothetical protein [Rhodothermus marinus]
MLNWQCRTLRAWQALRQVDFYIDRVSDVNLAGVELDHVRSYEDLTLEQTLRISQALARGTLPLRFQLHLIAENPADNPVTARLERLEWTLLLDDHPTLSGTLDQTYRLPPGEPQEIPLDFELDLLDFFEKNLQDLVELALALAGAEGVTKRVSSKRGRSSKRRSVPCPIPARFVS